MYINCEDGVSLSSEYNATLDMSLASPGSTSSPLFLKVIKNDVQVTVFQQSLAITYSKPGTMKMLVSPDDIGLFVIHWHHFNHYLFLELVLAVSQLNGKTVLHVFRIIMQIH